MANSTAYAPQWVVPPDASIIDHDTCTFVVLYEQDATGLTPYEDGPAAPCASRCEAWERGHWHYVTIRVTAVDACLQPLKCDGIAAGRVHHGLPSDGDIFGAVKRLCSEIALQLSVPPGAPEGEEHGRFP